MGRSYQPSAAKQAEADARREELIAQLQDGIDKLTESAEWQRYLDCQSKFHQYSFSNTLLILSQMPEASAVASFKRWQEMGRQVNRGEHGLRIFAPSTRKVEIETESGTTEKQTVVGFRLVPVFDISQTSGEELPEPVKLLEGEAPEGVFATLTKVAESIGFGVHLVPEVEDHPGANGVCRHDSKLIEVATAERSALQQVKTLAHEIGHAILHGTAEERADRGTAELEAESTAYVVCQTLGLDTSEYSFGYVAGWSGDRDEVRDQIKASGARIHLASKAILDGLEKSATKSEPEADLDFEAA